MVSRLANELGASSIVHRIDAVLMNQKTAFICRRGTSFVQQIDHGPEELERPAKNSVVRMSQTLRRKFT